MEADLKTLGRFWDKVQKSQGCWVWAGCKKPGGYGSFKFMGKAVPAHAFSLFLKTGKWPRLSVLHGCDNPPCVNPWHLREGTRSENTKDSVKRGRHFEATKTHCDYGHPFDSENTLFVNGGRRRCRACGKAACLKYYYSKKARA